ncbi:hypothetical protein E2C01_028741 [Portunus trituberculatus]|uniref:Uncharacterized protein n=1 Tax=Portunus trituberculatus TaxID=210409 RepID=A0A5B7EPU6_PORTR|nr:hypothetical protein [Portunus trituberculatus]
MQADGPGGRWGGEGSAGGRGPLKYALLRRSQDDHHDHDDREHLTPVCGRAPGINDVNGLGHSLPQPRAASMAPSCSESLTTPPQAKDRQGSRQRERQRREAAPRRLRITASLPFKIFQHQRRFFFLTDCLKPYIKVKTSQERSYGQSSLLEPLGSPGAAGHKTRPATDILVGFQSWG